MRPTVGIIGGSGPLATVDIEQKILNETKKIRGVLTDQDYYNLVVFNYCNTHDRNDSIFFGNPDPVNQYVEYISSIAALDIDLILLACNTAHMYLPTLKEKTDIPIISIIEKTLSYFKTNLSKISKVGLISTRATKEKKLYYNLFYKNGIEVLDINSDTQDSIMEAIYLIKAGVELSHDEAYTENTLNMKNTYQISVLKNHPYKKVLVQSKFPNPKIIVKNAINELKRKGCNHIIFGCTELPLVIPYLNKESNLHFIDPNTIIAEATVELLMEIENKMWPNNEIYMNEKRYV